MQINNNISLKSLIVQYHPVKGDVSQSTAKVMSMVDDYIGKDIDIVVMPECALTGYSFKARQNMQHLAEIEGKGQQFAACTKIAKLLNAYLAMGYMERETEAEDSRLFNSCYLVDRSGKLIANYRKMLMFETDKLYFTPGTQQVLVTLENTKGQQIRAAIGICMDINYKDFENFYQFPLAEHCRDNQVDCLIFPTAWIHRPKECTDKNSLEIAMETYEWWLMRLTPMLNKSLRLGQEVKPRFEKEWVMLAADRVGVEGDTTYKGCSAAISFNKPSSICKYMKIDGMLDEKIEKCLYSVSELKR